MKSGPVPVVEPALWHRLAACRGSDRMFPTGGAASHAEALAICADCPAVEPCLRYALSMAQGDRWGVWGGFLFEAGRVTARGAVTYTALLRSYLRFVEDRFDFAAWCGAWGIARQSVRHILRPAGWLPVRVGRSVYWERRAAA